MVFKILIVLAAAFAAFEMVEHLVLPLFWILMKKKKSAFSGAEAMIGRIGEVRAWNGTEGKVFVHGEIWNSTCETPLSVGDKAVIYAVDGLTLRIKPRDEATF